MNENIEEDEFDEPATVTITAFGHRFEDILAGNAQDLKTLEAEGAFYETFVDLDESSEFTGLATRYRIALTPPEIVEFVDASRASQEFMKAYKVTKDFAASVLAISDPKYRERVVSYHEYGQRRNRDGSVDDIRGCLASFLGPDLEDLVCGGRSDRYEESPALGGQSNKNELVLRALKSIAISARRLSDRGNNRPDILVTSEYDVQDLAEVALSAIFSDVTREEWTPKNAGSAKRIDVVIPSLRTVVECKYVRDRAHARRIGDELKIDFESYHDHPACGDLFAYIYDPSHFIADPERFADDLSGLRQKRGHTFSVYVLIN